MVPRQGRHLLPLLLLRTFLGGKTEEHAGLADAPRCAAREATRAEDAVDAEDAGMRMRGLGLSAAGARGCLLFRGETERSACVSRWDR